MKKYLLFALTILSLATGCTPGENKIDPRIQSKVPDDVTGKWMWGVFSLNNFWSYNGQYAGKPYEQALVLDFKQNSTYEMYVINSATSYSCKTEAFTYMKGKVKFDEEEQSFTLTPTSGNYRGFYSCYPSKNFKRDAKSSELKVVKYYYEVRGSQLIISGEGNEQGMTLKSTDW